MQGHPTADCLLLQEEASWLSLEQLHICMSSQLWVGQTSASLKGETTNPNSAVYWTSTGPETDCSEQLISQMLIRIQKNQAAVYPENTF